MYCSCTSCHIDPGAEEEGPWPCGPNTTNASRRAVLPRDSRRKGGGGGGGSTGKCPIKLCLIQQRKVQINCFSCLVVPSLLGGVFFFLFLLCLVWMEQKISVHWFRPNGWWQLLLAVIQILHFLCGVPAGNPLHLSPFKQQFSILCYTFILIVFSVGYCT